MPTKKAPKPSAATTASPTPAAARRPLPLSPNSIEASIAPASASAMPRPCAVVGAVPSASETTIGSSAAIAEIGATTLIVPTASAR